VDRWVASLPPVYREYFAGEGAAVAGKVEPEVEAVVVAVAVVAAVAEAIAELVAGVGNRGVVDVHLVPGSLVVEHSGKLAAHCTEIVAERVEPIAGNFHTAYGFADRGKLTGPGKEDMHHPVALAHRAVGFVVDFAGIPVGSIDLDKHMPADSGKRPFRILSFLLNNPASPRNLLP
jgi:hypothetical protein